MDERAGGDQAGGFLPPRPAGPEPDLSDAPPAAREPAGDQAFLPPQHASSGPQWQQPQPQQPQPAHGWPSQPLPKVPDNGDAVAGIILSVTAAALLLLSVGLSSIISVICAGLGIFYSRKGRARVDRGETPKHRGVAEAGFWVGIVTLVLSILMTILWVTVAILYATDEGFREDLQDELDDDSGSPDGFETAVPLGLAALRGVGLLLR